MNDFFGYIVPVQSDLFVLIIVKSISASQYNIYLNTSPYSLTDVTKELESLQNLSISIKKDIPTDISDIASKIYLIKQGFDQDTSKISLDYSDYTEKQIQVIKTTMTIPVDEIWPYSKVAEKAGLPKAQRFVGTTMRTLRQPYIVPVQRVKSISYLKKKTASSKRKFNKMPL